MNPQQYGMGYNVILTGMLLGMGQGSMIATRILPNMPQKLAAQAFGELGDEALRRYELTRSPGSATKRINITIKGKVYTVIQKAVEVPITIELLRESDVTRALNVGAYPEVSQLAVTTISDVLALDYEIETAKRLSSAATYPTGNVITLTGTSLWSDDASKPIDDIQEAAEIIRQKAGVRPNKLALGAIVYARLLRHPQILGAISGNVTKVATDDLLKQLFNVEEIVVGDAIWVNEQGVNTDVWGNMALLSYSPAVSVSTASPIRAPFGITSVMEGHPYAKNPYFEDQSESWVYGGKYERQPNLLRPAAAVLFDKPLAP